MHGIMELDQHVDAAKPFQYLGTQQRKFVSLGIADDQGPPRGWNGLPKGRDRASSTNTGSLQHTIKPGKCAGKPSSARIQLKADHLGLWDSQRQADGVVTLAGTDVHDAVVVFVDSLLDDLGQL